MRVLLMAQCYWPEEVSAAVLITELAVDLVGRGHEVTIITGAPNYPHGRVFSGYRNRLYQLETRDAVRIVRTWSYISPNKAFWRRLLNFGSYSATALYGGLLAGKPDVLVSFSPPLPLGLSAWSLSRLWRIPWILQLNDLYPEAAVNAGVVNNRLAIAFLSGVERFLYREATHISLLSDGFRRNLLGKGIPSDKISVIPVWADPDVVRPMPKENAFRAENGLGDDFVVMYAGNLGHTSSLEDVLAAAISLRDERKIRFVVVGEGVKKAALHAQAQAMGMENVLFLPFQAREHFAEMLAAADVGLVTLNSDSSKTSLPSKTFNIMASARPILAVTPPDSEIAELVREARCGLCVPPGRPDLLAESIKDLRGQEEKHLLEMGQNGRAQLETRFSRGHCVDLYARMLARFSPTEILAV